MENESNFLSHDSRRIEGKIAKRKNDSEAAIENRRGVEIAIIERFANIEQQLVPPPFRMSSVHPGWDKEREPRVRFREHAE